MSEFLNSSESIEIQDNAFIYKVKPVLEKALAQGWTHPRQIAIVLGVSNSIGNGGFRALASKLNWNAEKILKAYVGTNAHRQRREAAINEHFPNQQ